MTIYFGRSQQGSDLLDMLQMWPMFNRVIEYWEKRFW